MLQNIKNKVNKITNQLLKENYVDIDTELNNNIISPDKDTIINIILQLRNIIFPKYFMKNYSIYTKKENFSIELQDILHNLSKQISIVLRYSPKFQKLSESSLSEIGKDLALKFIEKLPKVKILIYTDLQASFNGDPAAFNKPEIIYSYPGLFAIMVNRLAHELYLLDIPLIPRIMTEYAHTITGIDIHPGASLGKNFFIDHGTGIVIGETAIIGDNVKIYQGVTIGALSTRGGQNLKGKKRHPTIEDNVIIYANASILGGNTVIGRNSIIGGNTFITESIPSNTKVSIKNQELEYK